jgi:hypothetical protein
MLIKLGVPILIALDPRPADVFTGCLSPCLPFNTPRTDQLALNLCGKAEHGAQDFRIDAVIELEGTLYDVYFDLPLA